MKQNALEIDAFPPQKKPKFQSQPTLNHSEVLFLSSEFRSSKNIPTSADTKSSYIWRLDSCRSCESSETIENEVIDLPTKRPRDETNEKTLQIQPKVLYSEDEEEEETGQGALEEVDQRCPKRRTAVVIPGQSSRLLNDLGSYHIIQSLHDVYGTGLYYIWTRYGDNGSRSHTALKGPFSSLPNVSTEYFTQCYLKTAAGFTDFLYHPLISLKRRLRSTEKKVENLSRLLTSEKARLETLKDVGFGGNIADLSQYRVKEGFKVLSQISKAIETKSLDAIPSLTEAFYTLIPHKQPYDTDPDTQIDHIGKLRTQTSLLRTLSSMQKTPLPEEIQRKLKLVDQENPLFSLLEGHLQSTHGRSLMYGVTVEDVYEVINDAIEDDEAVGLWYGDRLSNWGHTIIAGIPTLQESPESTFPHCPGATFSDASARVTPFCCPTRKHSLGFIGLCAVSLGNAFSGVSPNPKSVQNEGFDSVKVLGRMAPRRSLDIAGLKVMSGTPEKTGEADARLIYNEFVVNDPSKIRLKFLFQLRFNYD